MRSHTWCLFYRALLQKRPIIFRSLLIVATLYGSSPPSIYCLLRICVRIFCVGASQKCANRYYGVASVSRIDKMIGLFCKRALQKRRYSAKETYNLIDPTDCSHPIYNITAITGVAPPILIERNPPPRGGSLFTMFPHQEP